MSSQLLLIEDDPALCEGLTGFLTLRGYGVDIESSGQAGLARLLAGAYQLVILDVNLPDTTGFEVVRQLRQAGSRIPVILLTARDAEFDKVLGFELGIDDYVTKPFSIMELLGRLQAVLRRTHQHGPTDSAIIGTAEFDFKAYKVQRPLRPVDLPTKAFELLRYLVQCQGQAVTRDQLLDAVWGRDRILNHRIINNLVVVLRQAIEEDPENPKHLKTVHGVGYRLTL